MASTSLMFGALAHFYEKPVVVLATSCAGALAVLYGKITQLQFVFFFFSLNGMFFRLVHLNVHQRK